MIRLSRALSRLLRLLSGLLIWNQPNNVLAVENFQIIAQFDIPEARQGIAIDRHYFYAIGNSKIAKYDKTNGRRTQLWQDRDGGRFIHLNGAVVIGNRLYAAHSNWPDQPFQNSVEIWDATTLKHLSSYRFDHSGLSAFNWLDYYHGNWWGGFAGYDGAGATGKATASEKPITFVAKMNKNWQIIQRWTFPDKLLAHFGTMSHSGGSFGEDGFLYLTGHDRPEIYQLRISASASELEWLGTLLLNIRGQGIAWDRSENNVLYGIVRTTDAERARGVTNKVVVFKTE